MRFLSVPKCIILWYSGRIQRIRAKQVAGWAIAELICMSLSLFAIIMLLILGGLKGLGQTPPLWFHKSGMQIFMAGAVGYLTNLIAVTMLFRPYDSEDNHPVGMVPLWSQGLVPKNKKDLAETAGKQVADRLLTPEAITDEIVTLVEGAFENENMQTTLRQNLGPVFREKLPSIVDAIIPEMMPFLRELIKTGSSPKNRGMFVETVIDPWLNTNKEYLVDCIIDFAKHKMPLVVEWLYKQVEKEKEKGFWKKVGTNFAEWALEINWEDAHVQLSKRLDDEETRKYLSDILENIYKEWADEVKHSDLSPHVKILKVKTSDFIISIVEEILDDRLPELGHKVADSRGFWRSLSTEAVPSIKPYVISWLKKDGLVEIKNKFNISGRVSSAIDNMNVKEIHNMINEVSARHLGAIQVLGYCLGSLAGLCLMFI